jgi:hypothetical protein
MSGLDLGIEGMPRDLLVVGLGAEVGGEALLVGAVALGVMACINSWLVNSNRT